MLCGKCWPIPGNGAWFSNFMDKKCKRQLAKHQALNIRVYRKTEENCYMFLTSAQDVGQLYNLAALLQTKQPQVSTGQHSGQR
jgi:hypothetical protein